MNRKTIIWLALLSGLLLLLVILTVVRSRRQPPVLPAPSPTPIPTQPPLIGEPITGKVVLPTDLRLPATAAAINATTYLLTDQQARAIALRVGFADKDRVSNLGLPSAQTSWSNQQSFLTIDITKRLMQYGTYLVTQPDLLKGELPTPEAAKAAAINWIATLWPYFPTLPSPVLHTNYFQFGGENPSETDNISAAQTIKVDIFGSVNNLPVFSLTPTTAPVSIIVGPNSKVLFADLSLGVSAVATGDDIGLKSVTDLQSAIATEGKIVSAIEQNGDTAPDALTQYQQIIISKVTTGYSWQSNPSAIEPVFFLTGQATRLISGPVQITILVPAAKSTSH